MAGNCSVFVKVCQRLLGECKRDYGRVPPAKRGNFDFVTQHSLHLSILDAGYGNMCLHSPFHYYSRFAGSCRRQLLRFVQKNPESAYRTVGKNEVRKTVVTLAPELTPEAEAQLRAKAARAGVDEAT